MKTNATPAELRRAATRAARDIDRVQAALKGELSTLYARFARELKTFLKNPENYAQRSRFNLQATIKIIDGMQELLRDAGLPQLMLKHRAAYDQLANTALEYFVDQRANLKGVNISMESLDAFVKFRERELEKLIDTRLVGPVQSVVFQSAIGNTPIQQAIDQVLAVTDALSGTSITREVNFALEAFQRSVTIETAEALGLEIYQYVGPNDEITSPQCRAMLEMSLHGVPGMFYVDEVTIDLHEDLVYDPLRAGGHPGCRHEFLPVSREYAIEQGFKP